MFSLAQIYHDTNLKLVICLPTKHLGVFINSFKRVCAFQVELEVGSVGI